ncbi:hypothetical protein APY03_0317 [Variovorax sp. WDL1]|nr:hypothetical protein APY03_0317 [Variovorax sp. WDL1]
MAVARTGGQRARRSFKTNRMRDGTRWGQDSHREFSRA